MGALIHGEFIWQFRLVGFVDDDVDSDGVRVEFEQAPYLSFDGLITIFVFLYVHVILFLI